MTIAFWYLIAVLVGLFVLGVAAAMQGNWTILAAFVVVIPFIPWWKRMLERDK